jgi:hypothetical protein
LASRIDIVYRIWQRIIQYLGTIGGVVLALEIDIVYRVWQRIIQYFCTIGGVVLGLEIDIVYRIWQRIIEYLAMIHYCELSSSTSDDRVRGLDFLRILASAQTLCPFNYPGHGTGGGVDFDRCTCPELSSQPCWMLAFAALFRAHVHVRRRSRLASIKRIGPREETGVQQGMESDPALPKCLHMYAELFAVWRIARLSFVGGHETVSGAAGF